MAEVAGAIVERCRVADRVFAAVLQAFVPGLGVVDNDFAVTAGCIIAVDGEGVAGNVEDTEIGAFGTDRVTGVEVGSRRRAADA